MKRQIQEFRTNIRMTLDDQNLIEKAADILQTSRNAFIVNSAVAKANIILDDVEELSSIQDEFVKNNSAGK